MNEPIISPWLFYFADMLCPLPPILSILFISACIVYWANTLKATKAYENLVRYREFNHPDWINEEKEELKSFKKKTKIAKCFIILFALLTLLIPSKDTAYKMYISYHVTPSSIQMAEDMVDKSIDKVIEKIINYQVKLGEKKK